MKLNWLKRNYFLYRILLFLEVFSFFYSFKIFHPRVMRCYESINLDLLYPMKNAIMQWRLINFQSFFDSMNIYSSACVCTVFSIVCNLKTIRLFQVPLACSKLDKSFKWIACNRLWYIFYSEIIYFLVKQEEKRKWDENNVILEILILQKRIKFSMQIKAEWWNVADCKWEMLTKCKRKKNIKKNLFWALMIPFCYEKKNDSFMHVT